MSGSSDCTVPKKFITISLLEPRWEDSGAGVDVISAGAVAIGVIVTRAVAVGVNVIWAGAVAMGVIVIGAVTVGVIVTGTGALGVVVREQREERRTPGA
ncbi:hypothetical protein M0R45_019770 [Rubus argutus]|uniref:Uncharacterized protein n=1 Tax=Rubus argutus TaxID=59490 RepID=A0AAW1X9X8_RUBAR